MIPDWSRDFLPDLDPVNYQAPDGFPRSLRPAGKYQQAASYGLEIVLTEASKRPSTKLVRTAWQKVYANRPSPVLLVVRYPGLDGHRATVCGAIGASPVVVAELELLAVARLADVALSEPDRHAALRCLLKHIPELDRPLPGLRNMGLLATQELEEGVPRRPDWQSANEIAKGFAHRRDTDLVQSLGFKVERLATNVAVLTVKGSPRAVAIFCRDDEPFEAPSARLGGITPVSLALAQASEHNRTSDDTIDWVVLTRATEIRLYPTRPDVGVGRRGRAETFVEANLALLPASSAGYVQLLFSADALEKGGYIDELLESSKDFASKLAVRLRERVYGQAVPDLATAIAARAGPDLSERDLSDVYQQVMVILFRLLFTAYAEDKDLLPYRTNTAYRERSLKFVARERSQLLQLRDSEPASDTDEDASFSLWERVTTTWKAVDQGNDDWGVPAYNGGLFSEDPSVSAAGAALATVALTNAEFAEALDAVLLNDGAEGRRPVDFRSLSAREFGTIYEGLLESRLSVARSDLTLKSSGESEAYAPASASDDIAVAEGGVYLHHKTGIRKTTGSYFTKAFAVEHLLDEALEPSLDRHLKNFEELRAAKTQSHKTIDLYEAFFDFRCADIAMGSGHFLVAAVDRIEARLSGYLSLNPVPEVIAELRRLHAAAETALGELAAGVEIETASILRRQVARHCIYGIDLQPIAVELARLAVWIHTFVPGLPLSFLDHNLITGNSLTGVATLDDAVTALDPTNSAGDDTLFRRDIIEGLAAAKPALRRLARASDANKREILEAREAHLEAEKAVDATRNLFDLVSASRAGVINLPETIPIGKIDDHSEVQKARSQPEVMEALERLQPVHYPTAFPEIFLDDNGGFDCLLGNPPWEELVIEEDKWWKAVVPELHDLVGRRKNAKIQTLRKTRHDLMEQLAEEASQIEIFRQVLKVSFPGFDTGDPEAYKAFCWRKWQLTRTAGFIGTVLPRTALQTEGSARWRRLILEEGLYRKVTTLLNSGGWVFDDVHYQYTVALVAIEKTKDPNAILTICGPFLSLWNFLDQSPSSCHAVPIDEFRTWSTSAGFPQVPASPGSLTLFRKLRAHPRFDRTSSSASQSDSQRPESSSSPEAELTLPRTQRERWHFRPHAELHATNDRRFFTRLDGPSENAGQLEHQGRGNGYSDTSLDDQRSRSALDRQWNVYSGESFHLWEPDRGIYYGICDADKMVDVLQARRIRQHKNRRSPFFHLPRETIDDPQSLPCLRPRVAFRDVTNATNTRTVLAALVPGGLVLVNQAPYLLRIAGDERDEAYVLGILASMILDWYARRTVDKHVNFYLLNDLPVPEVDVAENATAARVVQLAGRLAATDDRFSDWAARVSVPVGSVNDRETEWELTSELDACVAHLYGLSEDDLDVIYTTFDEKDPDKYIDRRNVVIKYFRQWQ